MKQTRISLTVGCSLTLLMMTGCRELSTQYGASKGSVGHTSLNGFGALRRTFENAGFQTRDASRLTHRVRRADAIVWIPQIYGAIESETMQWFEQWLAEGDKTLVYIVPDSGSEAEYWSQAAALAAPGQRLEYRKRSANAINQRMTWRANRQPVRESAWFDVVPFQQPRVMTQFSGPWAKHLAPNTDSQPAPMRVEITISVPVSEPDATAQTAVVPPPLAPVSPVWPVPPTGPTPNESWLPIESEASTIPITMSSLLATANGDATLVAEIQSDQWAGSRILVVAGGSLLTNFAFSRLANRRLADNIVAASQPVSRVDSPVEPLVAFATSPQSSIPVSDSTPGMPTATGMEILTVWPISLITMHGLLLTLVVGLALLPIFGRPQRVQTNSQRDFGDHLDAVAALLARTGDAEFARSRVSEYRQRLHRESRSATTNDPSAPHLFPQDSR